MLALAHVRWSGHRIAPRCRFDTLPPFFGRNIAWNRMANPLEAGKVPKIRKVSALLRFHRLDGTVVADEKRTFAIRFFEQRKPTAIRTQARVPRNELRLTQAQIRRNARDLGFGQADLAGPAATRGAALAFMENRHGAISEGKQHPCNLDSHATNLLNAPRLQMSFTRAMSAF